ncbi:sensor histidine kinase [Clostridium sp. Marseille-P299]|uniref:sensor histidine kinase n=1 Tax=Clostridium sp. Marseille-P299 TaxID=1805477 RepID=UPI00082E186C|nr:HAMP domain-containing sensor histidine kinase [Clostridium sp. Marseille-P299]
MYIKINRKLRLIYTIMAGGILTTVMFIVFFLSENQLKMSQRETFRNNVYTIAVKLQSENTITNTWLSATESKNNMVIYIEDDGKALRPHGTWILEDTRKELVNIAREKAKIDGLDISIPPVSYRDLKTNYYNIVSKDGMKFYSAVILIPKGNGFRSAILFQYFNRPLYVLIRQILIYVGIDVFGILAFYLVSKVLIDRTLYPVEESRRKQTEFIAAASHELKSPLAVIRTSASAILKIPEKASKYTNNIENECMRMARLIDDLLILSSTDAKQWSLKSSTIELDTMLIDIFEGYEQICKTKGITLEIVLPDEVIPKIYGDSVRLRQVLMILLDNALGHSQTKDKLTLKAYTKRNYIYIEVIDYGIGIKDEEKEHIFDRFYRMDNSRNDKEHFGLGLSIAKELVMLHGGTLTIDDTEGGGSTFIIKLPIPNGMA